MRVLHLLDAADAQCHATTLAMLGDGLGRLGNVQQTVLLLGPRSLAAQATAVGIHHAQRLNILGGRALFGAPSVLGFLRRHGLRRGAFDLIHCWSIHPLGTLSLAALLFPRTPRVATVCVPPSPRTVHWLRMLVTEAPAATVLLPMSATLRRALLSHGVPEPAVHVVRPGLDFGRVAHQRRAELRQRWNVQPTDFVVAPATDGPTAGDARDFIWPTGLAAEVTAPRGRPCILLLHPQQSGRQRVHTMLRHAGRAHQLVLEPALAQPWDVYPGADAVLAAGSHCGQLSLLWAMASNIPIIGAASYAVSEIVEDRHSALLGKPGDHKQLAYRLMQLMDDRQLAWKLRDAARHEAFSFFSRQRYCRDLLAVYAQAIAGKTIEVPPLPTTGGLRFTGR